MNYRGFASDNNAGVSRKVLEKIAEVNQGHVVGYGDDPYTMRAVEILKEQFGPETLPFLVFTGTAANVLSIAAVVQPYNSVLCAETSHLQEDECGAPERFTGCKLIPIATTNGKLIPDLIKPHLKGFGFEHHSQPRIVSISQSTEMGTVYTLDEIRELADFVHEYKLLLHIDGARLSNAAISLGVTFKEMTTDLGVDILSFGGTKNGLMAAESVIFLNKRLADNFKYLRKQGMQLASKMRFVAAQFIAYFENDLWKRNAQNANEMAQLLYKQVKDIPQIRITQKVESNGIFAVLPKKVIPLIMKEYFFYMWNEELGEVRWMTSFDTTHQDIDAFVKTLKKVLGESK
jgi:threonine aldolase